MVFVYCLCVSVEVHSPRAWNPAPYDLCGMVSDSKLEAILYTRIYMETHVLRMVRASVGIPSNS